MAEEEIGLYDKYRVIKTEDLNELNELAEMMWEQENDQAQAATDIIKWVEGNSISSMVFVLRPDQDYHARVALAAYAESVRAYKSSLADDLHGALELMDPPTKMEPD